MSASARSVQDLVDLVEGGGGAPCLLFWGHRRERDGSMGTGCLAAGWPAPFELHGVRFATVEHHLAWAKARLAGEPEMMDAALRASHPGVARSVGLDVPLAREVWQEQRWEIAVAAHAAKFEQNPAEGAYLDATAPQVLVGTDPADTVWGIGLLATDPAVHDPRTWRGQNLLGFTLMEVRDRRAVTGTARATGATSRN